MTAPATAAPAGPVQEGSIIDIRRELPDQQAELLRQALQHLAGVIELDDMVLGGGTALASRWSHRLSVDIDLFTSADSYRGIRPVLERRAEGWGERDGFANVRIHPNVIHCVLANGLEFSLGDGDDITHNPVSAEREASTGVRLQSTAEIIARKIRARMVNQAAYYIRDAYDVVCCQEHDPEALSEALSCLELDERRSLRYDSTLDGLRLDDTMPLLAPVHGHLRSEADLRKQLFGALVGFPHGDGPSGDGHNHSAGTRRGLDR